MEPRSTQQQNTQGGLLLDYYELLNAEAAALAAPTSLAAAQHHAKVRDIYHDQLKITSDDALALHIDMVRAFNNVRSTGRFPVLSDEVMRRGDRVKREPRR